MSILLFVLRIIGVLVLAVLALVVFLVVLVLFCPFGYRVRGSFHDKKLKGNARVTWLGGLLAFSLTYDESGAKKFLRIACFRKQLGGKDAPPKKKKTDPQPEEVLQRPLQTAEAGEPDETAAGDAENTAGETENAAGKKPSILERLRGFWAKLSAFFGKAAQWKKMLLAIQREAEDENNRAAVRLVLAEGKRLLLLVFPKRTRLSLSYSAGTPDQTGKLLGVLAAFPAAYKNRWTIRPDFTADAAYAEADLDARGRLFGIWIFLAALRIILDKNCKKIYNRIRHHR